MMTDDYFKIVITPSNPPNQPCIYFNAKNDVKVNDLKKHLLKQLDKSNTLTHPSVMILFNDQTNCLIPSDMSLLSVFRYYHDERGKLRVLYGIDDIQRENVYQLAFTGRIDIWFKKKKEDDDDTKTDRTCLCCFRKTNTD